MTPTPSAREPQAIAALRNDLKEAEWFIDTIGTNYTAQRDRQRAADILAAYDALVAERDALEHQRDTAGAEGDKARALARKLWHECAAAERERDAQFKALAKLSSALNNPCVEGETIEGALVEYAIALLRDAERERDALRGVVEKARQLDAVVYGNRPGGAGSFDERHRAQVEFIASLRALDGEARG